MLKRPQPGETEDDLLELQKQFLSSKESCSTQITLSKNIKTHSNLTEVNKSDKSQSSEKNLHHTVPSLVIKERNPVTHKTIVHEVSPCVKLDKDLPQSLSRDISKSGFPIPQKLPANLINKKSSGKKKSLFAQHFDSQYSIKTNIEKVQPSSYAQDKSKRDVITLPGTGPISSKGHFVSKLITGEGLKCDTTDDTSSLLHVKELEAIHKENTTVLANMTETEIMEEQEKIKKLLGSQLVSFVQSRSKSNSDKTHLSNDNTSLLNSSDKLSSNDDDQSKWLHMNVKEEDKMKWMTDVKFDPNKQPEFYREIRFSLTGLVIPRDVGVAIPSYKGLHHHGNEPECAGYTLGELIVLARSTVLQQRILSLQTLSHIIKRCHHGEYEGLIEGHPLSVLVESNVPLLFRYALDETTDSLQAVAIHGLHSLLISSSEETFLQWYTNTFHPSLTPPPPPPKDDKKEESVEDIMKRDIIKCLLQMIMLPRLRYILEVCRPQEVLVDNILEILIKVSRHSLQSTNEILKCPRLINVIMSCFLPTTWSKDGGIYERPHPLAMRLMCCMCRAGRFIAKELLATHSLLPAILRHVLVSPTDHTLTLQLSYQLCVESISTWTVLLKYGLATEEINKVYPILLNNFSSSSLSRLSSNERQQMSSLFNLASAAIVATPTIRPHPLIDPVLKYLVTITREFSDGLKEEEITLDAVQYITGLLNIVSTYYTQLYTRPELRGDPVSLLDEVKSITNSIITVILESRLCAFICKTVNSLLGTINTISCHFSPLPSYLPVTLPSKPAIYNSDSLNDKDYPLLSHNHSVLAVFSNFLRTILLLSLSVVQLYRGLSDRLCLLLLEKESVWIHTMELFTEQFNTINVSLSYYPAYSYIFTLLKLLVNSVCLEGSVDVNVLKLIHSTSLSLISVTPPGHEMFAKDLLNTVIFNPIFYRDVVTEAPPIATPTSLIPTSSHLSIIKDTYRMNIDETRPFNWLINGPKIINSQLFPSMSSGFIISCDWPHLPLINTYDESDVGIVAHYRSCLEFILFLELYRTKVLKATPPCERLQKVMNIFLISTELFFEVHIKQSLTSLFICYCQPHFLSSLDFSLSSSFQQMYTSLLDQFAAVSYGHQLFALFLLLPLQQKHSLHFRRDFWIDHTHILKLITLTPKEVHIPLDSFLCPTEWDSGLLEQYIKVLASETIIEEKNPFLFQIASGHIRSVLSSNLVGVANNSQTQQRVASIVDSLPNKLLKNQLLQSVL